MRRTRLALCTALALGVMLLLHPATAVDYESDEDTVDVEDVYAHVDALLDLARLCRSTDIPAPQLLAARRCTFHGW